ncbi:MAG: aminopeptidase [Flavobacteriales bacterium]|nr:aminopeptidase [Flavobacteriales bacterium]
MKKGFLTIALSVGISFGYAQQPNLPKDYSIVKFCGATEVKSQDNTGTCWSFSTSSFIESEVLKKTGKHIDLSEMFTVRNIYLEKAIKYIRYHGTCNFSQGSLAHDVFNSYKKYGMMPESAYSGLNGKAKHNHQLLEKELKNYLDSVIKIGEIDPHWNEGFSVILDKYLGVVNPVFEFDGKSYNARTFADEVLGLDLTDYIGLTSFLHHPFSQNMVVEVPDNFSDGEYYNVPLNSFQKMVDNALNAGYSIEWDGDVSEVGFDRKNSFARFYNDTISAKSNMETPASAELRQALFDNYKTTDDHLMHIVGLVSGPNKEKYYLVKNSWGNKSGFDGYLLMSETYFLMKTVSIYLNSEAIDEDFDSH